MTATEFKQTTIAKEVSLKGVGLHTGKKVTLNFKPAPADFGYAFQRIDLEGEPVIEALAHYVTDTKRGTTLDKNGVQINTCEHVLAALVGLEIDNCLIEIDTSEPPIMDGSAKFFVEALEEAGKVELEQFRKEFVVKEVISYKDEETGSEILLMPESSYQVTTMVDFGTKVLGTQNATLQKISNFRKRSPVLGRLVFFMRLKPCWNMG
jgi:UDP-3-O-[3-hydroxymyristoyl] N-acetylglucosamine deacetylase/3-hydroxyacyl-[acyl-carrier-protein] dehydratase